MPHPCDLLFGRAAPDVQSAATTALDTMLGANAEPLLHLEELLWLCKSALPQALGQATLPRELADLAAACRHNRELADLGLIVGRCLDKAAQSGWESLRAAEYCPSSPGSSTGGLASLTEADIADVQRFMEFAVRATFDWINAAAHRFPAEFFQDSQIPSEAAARATFSVLEASVFTFLRRRFPDIFYRGEWLDDGSNDEEARRGIQRKSRLFGQLWEFAHGQQVAIEQRMATEGSLRAPGAEQMAASFLQYHWEGIHRSFISFNNLQLQAEIKKIPRSTKRLDAPSPLPYPFVSTRSVQIDEPEDTQGVTSVQSSSMDRYFSLTHVTVDRVWTKTLIHKSRETRVLRAVLVQPQPGGPSSLSRASCIPLQRFMHPEDPVVLAANFMARSSDKHTEQMSMIFGELGITPEALLAAGGCPRLQLVTRVERGRRWLSSRGKRLYHMYFLLPRQDAERVGLEFSPLPQAEKRHLKFADAPLDDSVGVVWWETFYDRGDGNDGGDDDAPPSVPPADPQAVKEPEFELAVR